MPKDKASMEVVANALCRFIEFPDDNNLDRLEAAMDEYENRCSTSLEHAKRQPAFRMIWEAMKDGINPNKPPRY